MWVGAMWGGNDRRQVDPASEALHLTPSPIPQEARPDHGDPDYLALERAQNDANARPGPRYVPAHYTMSIVTSPFSSVSLTVVAWLHRHSQSVT